MNITLATASFDALVPASAPQAALVADVLITTGVIDSIAKQRGLIR